MPGSELYIRFGGNVASISCHDKPLYDVLHRHFRHCLGAAVEPLAAYRVDSHQGGVVELTDGAALLYRGDMASDLVELLMQEITTSLTANCRTHLVFHAAGLARGQCGVILCGGSGSGKSTLASWMIARGMDFLTDELAAVSSDLKEMEGLPRPILIKAGSAFVLQQWLDDRNRENLPRLSGGAVLLDPEALRPGCVVASASPRLVVFPTYAESSPLRTKRLSPAETLFRLMQRLINARNLPNLGFKACADLSRQVDGYSMTYSDVDLAVTWIESLT